MSRSRCKSKSDEYLTRREKKRRYQAYKYRKDTAKNNFYRPIEPSVSNGDEKKYCPVYFANFTKALPHDSLGQVDPKAYRSLLKAVKSGNPKDYNRIILGGSVKLTNPQAGYGFDLEGRDAQALSIPPAPRFSSREEAGEIVENYWMALTRDIPFSDYPTNPLIAEACADLTQLRKFKGAKINGIVTPETIFRSDIPGVLVGPYISQFFYLHCPFGANEIDQKMLPSLPGIDFMTTWPEYLSIQNGNPPVNSIQYGPLPRYIITGRDLSQWVHIDVLYQGYLQACLILLHIGAPVSKTNPYKNNPTQIGFGTLGGPNIVTLVPEVSTRALKTVWNQKWNVHRRLRPEEFGGCIDSTKTNRYVYPINSDALNSDALVKTFQEFGSYLLPQAFPEGCPTHPSYGAGHATVAGACVTILKAWFDEDYVIPNPMVPSADGLTLEPYIGPPLTVGGELNKIAHNVAFGRNIAGVHWRSDGTESLKLGEQVAIGLLRDQKHGYNEDFKGWVFRKFDGKIQYIN
jgi:hypothetical protein